MRILKDFTIVNVMSIQALNYFVFRLGVVFAKKCSIAQMFFSLFFVIYLKPVDLLQNIFLFFS